MENQNNTTILPLYQQVRQTMYDDFESLKRQNAIVQTCTKANLKYALMNYREKYLKFYFEINSEENLSKISQNKRENIIYYAKNLEKINKTNAGFLTEYARELLNNTGIMNISFSKKDNFPSVKNEHIKEALEGFYKMIK